MWARFGKTEGIVEYPRAGSSRELSMLDPKSADAWRRLPDWSCGLERKKT